MYYLVNHKTFDKCINWANWFVTQCPTLLSVSAISRMAGAGLSMLEGRCASKTEIQRWKLMSPSKSMVSGRGKWAGSSVFHEQLGQQHWGRRGQSLARAEGGHGSWVGVRQPGSGGQILGHRSGQDPTGPGTVRWRDQGQHSVCTRLATSGGLGWEESGRQRLGPGSGQHQALLSGTDRQLLVPLWNAGFLLNGKYY